MKRKYEINGSWNGGFAIVPVDLQQHEFEVSSANYHGLIKIPSASTVTFI